MRFRVFERSFLGLLALNLLCAVSALAQTDTASLSGTVVDPQGRPVTEVEVKATRIETGITTVAVTNSVGIYFLSGLTPGHYQIVASKPGFKEVVTTGLTLLVGGKVEQNFTLQIGSQSEKVTVEGSALPMDTQDATVGTVVDRKFAENIPLNGRSFQSLRSAKGEFLPHASSVKPGGWDRPMDSSQETYQKERCRQ